MVHKTIKILIICTFSWTVDKGLRTVWEMPIRLCFHHFKTA